MEFLLKSENCENHVAVLYQALKLLYGSKGKKQLSCSSYGYVSVFFRATFLVIGVGIVQNRNMYINRTEKMACFISVSITIIEE